MPLIKRFGGNFQARRRAYIAGATIRQDDCAVRFLQGPQDTYGFAAPAGAFGLFAALPDGLPDGLPSGTTST